MKHSGRRVGIAECRQIIARCIGRSVGAGVRIKRRCATAEALCCDIAIIDRGHIAERDRMSSLLRKLHSEIFVLNLREAVAAATQLGRLSDEARGRSHAGSGGVEEQNLNEIFSRLSGQRIEVLSMRNKVNRLEEIFMRLVDKVSAYERCDRGRAAAADRPARGGDESLRTVEKQVVYHRYDGT